MKIICIGRNYIEHARELKHEVPEEPVFFLKPDTCLIRENRPFFLPDFSDNIHYEAELVFRVGRLGKGIQEKFALSYVDAIALGVDFTARDIQQQCKLKGLPWEKSKAFDGSSPISKFLPFPSEGFPGTKDLSFRLLLNGGLVQQAKAAEMVFSIEQIIAHVSRYMTLKTGDLIYTGTPAGVGKVHIGDHLEAWLEDIKMLDFHVR